MHPRLAELTEYLRASRAIVRESLDAVPAQRRQAVPGEGRWSVAQIITHLALVEGRVTRLITNELATAREEGIGTETDTTPILSVFDVTRIVDRSGRVVATPPSQPPQGVNWRDGWTALRESREGLLTAIADADGLALAERSVAHPSIGELNLYQWIAFVGAHERRHAAQIREVAAALAELERPAREVPLPRA